MHIRRYCCLVVFIESFPRGVLDMRLWQVDQYRNESDKTEGFCCLIVNSVLLFLSRRPDGLLLIKKHYLCVIHSSSAKDCKQGTIEI